MAVPFSQSPFSWSVISRPKPIRLYTTFYCTRKHGISLTKHAPRFSRVLYQTQKFPTIPKASKEQESTTTDEDSAKPPAESQSKDSKSGEMIELGMEIKKAMEERAQKETGLLSGVAEEIREIEWPAFSRVLGTTGVVLGVLAGSSVVLLTVNAILAEISDRVFAGKGVQDFFG